VPTVTVDLQEGFEEDSVEVWLGGECRWRGDSVTTNLVISLAASVPLDVEPGEHELRVTVPSRRLDTTLRVDVVGDVSLAANVEEGRLRLERLRERPYYL
jgi:hypothetical protein